MTTLADSVSDLQTNAQGRAALGVMTQALNQAGYGILPQVTTDQGLQDVVRSDLDDAQAYASQLYEDIPNDGGDLSIYNAGRLGIAAWKVDESTNGAEEAAGVSKFDFSTALKKAVMEVSTNIEDAAKGVGDTVGKVAAAPFQGLVASLTSLLYGARNFILIAGGVGAVYVFRKQIFGAIKKAGG